MGHKCQTLDSDLDLHLSWLGCQSAHLNCVLNNCLSSGLVTRQSFWVILCCLPEKERKAKERRASRWEERNRGRHPFFNILNILQPKKENFQIKTSDIFHISAQNIDCGYSLEMPQQGSSNEYPKSMFFSKIRKIMYTPVNPSFTIMWK